MKVKQTERENDNNTADSMVSIFQTGEDQSECQEQMYPDGNTESVE